MSENITIELYGGEVLVGEHMAENTKFKMNQTVIVNKEGDPNNKFVGVVSGIVHKMSNASIIYMVHFGHNMAGHDANYLESDLSLPPGAGAVGGRRRKSRKSRKSRKGKKARKTRRRH